MDVRTSYISYDNTLLKDTGTADRGQHPRMRIGRRPTLQCMKCTHTHTHVRTLFAQTTAQHNQVKIYPMSISATPYTQHIQDILLLSKDES